MELAATIIKTARTRRGLTGRELCRQSGVPCSTLSRIERGHSDPAYSTVAKLLTTMGFADSELHELTPAQQAAGGAIPDVVTLMRMVYVKRALLQKEVSLLSGVAQSTLSRIGAGQVDPGFNMIMRIVDSLNFTGTSFGQSMDDSAIAQAIASNPPLDEMFDRYSMAAEITPIQFRQGVRLAQADVNDVITRLQADQIAYAVSSLEGVFREWIPGYTPSFQPIVYVDPRYELPWPSKDSIGTRNSVFFVPMTNRAASHIDVSKNIRFMSPAWSVIDAIASIGRQSDIGLNALQDMIDMQRTIQLSQ